MTLVILEFVELVPIRDQVHDAGRNGLQQRSQIAQILLGKKGKDSDAAIARLKL
jgi:hypothetical protein